MLYSFFNQSQRCGIISLNSFWYTRWWALFTVQYFFFLVVVECLQYLASKVILPIVWHVLAAVCKRQEHKFCSCLPHRQRTCCVGIDNERIPVALRSVSDLGMRNEMKMPKYKFGCTNIYYASMRTANVELCIFAIVRFAMFCPIELAKCDPCFG